MPAFFQLPDADPFELRCEADYYGASYLISSRLNLQRTPVSSSTWVHGCDILPVPRDVFSPMKSDPESTHLVDNLATQQWWRDNGYPRTIAVGCPFVYTEFSGRERIPGSVLAMPSHGLPGSSRDDSQTDLWFERVAGLKNQFSLVMVCVHENDVEALRPRMERHQLEWFKGAAMNSLALPRMRAIFDSFEFMVTDVQGSHLPYAAWSGCRVAILEPSYLPKWEHVEHHPHMKKYPETRKNIAFFEPEFMHARFPFLFPEEISKATCPREWAGALLGVDCKRSPEELARLLGWRADDSAFVDSAYEDIAGWLGGVNPDEKIEWLTSQVERWKGEHATLKTEHKALGDQLRKAQKDLDRERPFLASLSSRIARGLYSIEKRVRRLKGH